MPYTIKEVSEMTGIPASTLRYYDKEGLLPFIERKASGYRLFAESDIGMLRVIECLKHTGMPIKDIRKFAEWAQQGDASLQERYEMFLERRRVVEAQMEALKKTLELIEHKCWYYETALAAGTEAIHKKAPPCEDRQQLSEEHK
ncbi:MAG: MerR family transcriptional regulator [Clostridia bacterium]|nr:MerR family transcriptional regulator [Clostridia bacterium]